jgi:hypothetical protein
MCLTDRTPAKTLLIIHTVTNDHFHDFSVINFPDILQDYHSRLSGTVSPRYTGSWKWSAKFRNKLQINWNLHLWFFPLDMMNMDIDIHVFIIWIHAQQIHSFCITYFILDSFLQVIVQKNICWPCQHYIPVYGNIASINVFWSHIYHGNRVTVGVFCHWRNAKSNICGKTVIIYLYIWWGHSFHHTQYNNIGYYRMLTLIWFN